MGNEAVALGALAAGVNVICGYPGTPSTEVLESAAKRRPDGVYIEWSVNEKAAMELAAGASYSGARTLVTMKQVGLNVASDPLMSLEYVGVKGGMVVLVADDPGPISSQTEQDTRSFAAFSKLPCFDPSSVEEAYSMMADAYALSEKYHTPVFFRPTTRICHGYASVKVAEPDEYYKNAPEGFIKDSSKWVIFPALSYRRHREIEERNEELSEAFSGYKYNSILNKNSASKKGIASCGTGFIYAMQSLGASEFRTLKIATPFPFPEKLALEFLSGLDEVLCIEELDPVIERALIFVCGKYGLNVKIRGKLTGDIPRSGENTADIVSSAIAGYLKGEDGAPKAPPAGEKMKLPVRPPVLCAGCPHRASFYAVKQAMKGKKTVYCGDIGCYTLGNAKPLDMVDTCLCMGAGFTVAQGIYRADPETYCFGFLGDSTFFASGVTGAVNAVYNRANITLIVLDNSITAMTGHQPHPGTGKTVMGYEGAGVSIEKVLEGIGVGVVRTVDPLDLKAAVDCIKEVAGIEGVKAVIFRSPCVAKIKPARHMTINENKCVNCKKCIRELGCPAISAASGRAVISPVGCTGCGLCSQICPTGAIIKAEIQ
ncbi:MAG: indolepyruvate ferredoxin oxidoreductase subunit alpha [Clostridia bacterium]|nr:indolepyruvate ferredoxin oxidoreductase subunit alpha [Clostridia bacterium]